MHTLNAIVKQDLDVTLQPYLNVNVDTKHIQPYLDFLRQHLDPTTYLLYTSRQQLRDHQQHHLTVVSPPEQSKLSVTALTPLLGYPVTLVMLGVGHLLEEDNEVYYIVCESPEIQAMRTYLELPTACLHITLGFKLSDIFDQRKDRGTLLFPYSAVENHC